MSKKNASAEKKPDLLEAEAAAAISPEGQQLQSGNKEVEAETRRIPVVGIGASAGGLEAFHQFFDQMPADSGLAFVLVQHLSTEYRSALESIISGYTDMSVYQVEDGMRIQPNSVYIIPPNADMALLNNTLYLNEPQLPRGLRLPIDHFFRSLAQDLEELAVGIVLSGTGSDGTLGLREIDGHGGIVMVQEPATAGYDGMPRSAIQSNRVDYILPPAEMAKPLLEYSHRIAGTRPIHIVATQPVDEPNKTLQKIFLLLRTQAGHDFSEYKQRTILRRLDRRMNVLQIKEMAQYLAFLRKHPEEVQALFRDMLIGVTKFFRDPDVFAMLAERVVPMLIAKTPEDMPIRVWVAGCSSGEEAYSWSILLQEGLQRLNQTRGVQIFATDIDPIAIETARTGLYPAGIAADVSEERLARYFIKQGDLFQVNVTTRDTVVFAVQNVIQDPPFSKVAVVSCRNLLIYLNLDAQRNVLRLFHYALNPAGYLLLGNSETVGVLTNLFNAVDRKAKLFQCIDVEYGQVAAKGFSMPPLLGENRRSVAQRAGSGRMKTSFRDLVERELLRECTPTSVLINQACDILYIHGRAGKYLELSSGETSINILKMARDGLRMSLTMAIRKAMSENTPIHYPALSVKGNGQSSLVDLTVRPLTQDGLLLVLFQDVAEEAVERLGRDDTEPLTNKDRMIVDLERDLRAKDDYLQAVIEEMETSNEELKATNEEFQATNEELQSTNEELETSKEELQSVNEELITVNAELQQKIDTLSHVNNDMNNLMASIQIGTIFLDFDLQIQRFTPALTKIFNLIQTDIGRPLSDIVTNLNYESFLSDVQQVLSSLIPVEKQVETKDSSWLQVRIMPYRTVENVIEGAVVTFVDVTAQRKSEGQMRRLSQIIEQSPSMVVIADLHGVIDFVNKNGLKLSGYDEYELLGFPIGNLVADDPLSQAAFQQGWQVAIDGRRWQGEWMGHQKEGDLLWETASLFPILDSEDRLVRIALILNDVTEHKRMGRLAIVVRDSNDAIAVLDPKGAVLAWNVGAEKMYGWSEKEALAMNVRALIPEEGQDEAQILIDRLFIGGLFESMRAQRVSKEGHRFEVVLTATLLLDGNGNPYAISTIERMIAI